MDPHYLECARSALALRIEQATTHGERRELRKWLAEIEAQAKQDKRRDDDDGQPDEQQEWHDYDPEC